MSGACNTHGDKRNVYRNLVGRPEGKKSLGRPRRRWEDNINIDVGGIGWDGMDWVDLAQDTTSGELLRTWYTVNLRVP
jgi:hypothetical protein